MILFPFTDECPEKRTFKVKIELRYIRNYRDLMLTLVSFILKTRFLRCRPTLSVWTNRSFLSQKAKDIS
jgi:hypothetical protein